LPPKSGKVETGALVGFTAGALVGCAAGALVGLAGAGVAAGTQALTIKVTIINKLKTRNVFISSSPLLKVK
jgi:hypothetical protein